jgi:hypothetical protein
MLRPGIASLGIASYPIRQVTDQSIGAGVDIRVRHVEASGRIANGDSGYQSDAAPDPLGGVVFYLEYFFEDEPGSAIS